MEEKDSIQINLNSRFARKHINNSHSDCVFDLPSIIIPKNRHIHISVINAIIPYSFYNIDDSNNFLTYTINTVQTYALSVPIGNYNAFQLATYLRNEMTNITVVYDTITNKFIFTHQSMDFNFDASSSILKTIGFTEGQHTSSESILISNICSNLQRIQSIHIQTNFLTGNINSSDVFAQNTLCTIPVNTPPNSNIVYYNDNKFVTNLYTNVMNELSIKLVDQDNNILNLNGLDWSMTLQLDIVDFVN